MTRGPQVWMWVLVGVVAMADIAFLAVWADDQALPTAAEVGALGPAWAIATTAIVALVVGVATVQQKAAADRRQEWWRRAQWALDLSLDEDPQNALVGISAIAYLARSVLAGRDEDDMLAAVSYPNNELEMIDILAAHEEDDDPAVEDTDGR